MATTEPHKILATILSRCQRYDFSKVGDDDIRERIKVVLQKEHIEYNEEAINLIISLADGGMRDALSMLDQVLAYSGDKLDVQDVLNIFALESKEEKMGLIKSVARHDVNDVLARLGSYIERGTDIKRLTNDLLLILKDVLIYQTSRNDKYLQALTEADVKEFSGVVNSQMAMEMITILMDALKDYKNVTAINPLFEITLLKMSAISTKPVQNQEIYVEKPEPKPIPKPEPVKVEPPKPVVEEPKEETISLFDDDSVASDDNIIYIEGTSNGESYELSTDLLIDLMVTSKKEIKNSLLEGWKNIKRLIAHPKLGKIASMLVDGRPLVASNKSMIVEFQSDSVAEKMNLVKNQKDIQNIVRTVFGKKMFVYAVNRKGSVDSQTRYRNLLELGRLPKADNVVIEYVGDK